MNEWSALLRSFWHITMLHLQKPGLSKLCAWLNRFILQDLVVFGVSSLKCNKYNSFCDTI